MDRTNAGSWAAVAAAVVGVAIYTGLDHRGLTPTPHPAVTTSTGQANPREVAPLASTPGLRVSWDEPKRWVTFAFIVNNFGPRSVTIASVGRSGPGMELIHGSATPETVPPQDGTTVTVTYWVRDCTAGPRDVWPIPVTFTAAGDQSTQFLDPGVSANAVPWQSAAACRVPPHP